MLSSPYFQHALYSIACLSISINLLSTRRLAEQDKSRAAARISILESVRDQLAHSPRHDDDAAAARELERLMRLGGANRTESTVAGGAAGGGDGDDVSWGDIFSGKGPKVGVDKDGMSRWEREDLEKLQKELK